MIEVICLAITDLRERGQCGRYTAYSRYKVPLLLQKEKEMEDEVTEETEDEAEADVEDKMLIKDMPYCSFS